MKLFVGLLVGLAICSPAYGQSGFAQTARAAQAIGKDYARKLATFCPGPGRNGTPTGILGDKISIDRCDYFQVIAPTCVRLAIMSGTYLDEFRSGASTPSSLRAKIDNATGSDVGTESVAVSIAEAAARTEGAGALVRSVYRGCISHIR